MRATERRFFAPEVVQTSAMDCGPAALKCLLEGFGIAVSYGRLREACQTDVDGTSIDTLEDVAQQLGLQAQQVLAPVEHLLLPVAQLLPALVVTAQPNGATHFVVVWRRVGPWIQVMDPAVGRRWVSHTQFEQEVYQHQLVLSAESWRTWAGAAGFCDPLRARLRDLGLTVTAANQLVEAALDEVTWRPLAALDATTHFVASVVRAGGTTRGAEAAQLVEKFFAQARYMPTLGQELLPAAFWSVQPLLTDTAGADAELLLVRGAVLLQVSGRQTLLPPMAPIEQRDSPASHGPDAAATVTTMPQLTSDLLAALAEPAGRERSPIWAIRQALRADGFLTPGILAVAAMIAALGVTLEAVLLRGLMAVNSAFGQVEQRILLAVGVLIFSLALFLVEAPLSSLLQQLGRQIETRLRIALLEKIPRLGDRYFHSRLISDMAQRAYSLHQLHSLPSLSVNVLRQSFQLLFTAAGLIWLAPASAPLALVVILFAGGVAFLSQPLLAERDLRVRTHTSALSRFYLDALLGLLPIRAHSAERAVRREHEMLLVEWARASWGLAQIEMLLQTSVALVGIGSASWIVLRYLANGGEAIGVLLLLYWALNLPALSQSLVTSAQQYPMVRNHLLRLLEPLGAPEEDGEIERQADTRQETRRHGDTETRDTGTRDTRPSAQKTKRRKGKKTKRPEASALDPVPKSLVPSQLGVNAPQGVTIVLKNVTVQAGGHTVLHELDLTIAPGEHVAIVGPSGAGKSSLVGLLLGWHRPAAGQLWVDEMPLWGEHLQQLRRVTAWVDPAVQLWNRDLTANLQYGLAAAPPTALDSVLMQANLYEILERLPHGLQTALGEGGGLVSGGEGQRVRLGRALLRPDIRLAILDEPFRGLDRQQRHQLLTNARQHWQTATLLCITHDVTETLDFTRILVIEDGRLVEDGSPQMLAAQPGSRYQALLAADTHVQASAWAGTEWRRLWLERGELREA